MEEKEELEEIEKVEDGEEGVWEAEEVAVEGVKEDRLKMEGMASIALLPNGSISGHFVHLPHSVCYGIHGTELACERECSRGEDYCLVKLTIIDFNSKKERDVVVERRGHDAARLCNVDHAHGWEKDVVNLVDEKHKKSKIVVSFKCETLKADEAAEEHLRRFMPKLTGMDAVVNIGKMSITGLDFKAEVGVTEPSS
ncbi:uncharacterized protein LOC112521143 isoform X1 [Cynara cardunculus var. scolymus]|uniref:Uncharacterized protein n=2 Tax=Cynara cardunculus var. scolymus TaxID=59895 RepID=A0A103YHD3_CYNCS|nr:uncharacterized protein LOC112521143 isoform X1 [Cynara cardunculus var. scolymus]KVI09132.1 hypothetical protein Ccrd_012537 [Cynara cardunculus var. scolymus]